MTNKQKIDALTNLLTLVIHTLDLKQYQIDDPTVSYKCEVEADDYYNRMISILNSEEHLTHESMLEIAAQREAMNAKKLEIEKQFDEWFGKLEGYSFRSERFWDDFYHAKDSKDNQSMMVWLRTAFEQGYYACESKKDT